MHTCTTLFMFLVVIAATSCHVFAQTFSVTIPQSSGNSHANTSVGYVTNAFKDGSISADSAAKLFPKMLRWPEGGTGNKIHFDKNNPGTFKVGIHNKNAWWRKYIGADTTNWTTSPQFNFDEFIALCKSINCQPVVILGIAALYDTSSVVTMSRQEVISAAKDFVTYANVTKKYNVKFWEIGNEDDLEGASAVVYANIFNELVPLLKSIDPTIQCGANSMTSSARWDTLIPLVQSNANFYITHCYGWFGKSNYADWYTHEAGWDWAPGAKNATASLDKFPSAAKSLFVTEISSYSPTLDVNDAMGNVTWKGLLNIQMQLETLARPYTRASLFWNTRWSDDRNQLQNLFGTDYKPNSAGWSVAAYSAFLYNNLGAKLASDTATFWVSHNDIKDKMSVFLMNRCQSPRTASVTISGYAGTWKNERWVYKGSSPTSTDATFFKTTSLNISANIFSVPLDPLSFTVINFSGDETGARRISNNTSRFTEAPPVQTLFTLQGKCVDRKQPSQPVFIKSAHLNLRSGIYLVKSPGTIERVMVK